MPIPVYTEINTIIQNMIQRIIQKNKLSIVYNRIAYIRGVQLVVTVLSQCPLNPEASHTNVSEETPGYCVSVHCTCLATGVTSVQWDKDIPAGQTLP